jgi:superfamily I DNA and/or RNA helicase
MNLGINGFPSKTHYSGKLVAAPSVAGMRLCHVPGVEETEYESSCGVYRYSRADFPNLTPGGDESALLGESKRNEGEVKIATEMVRDLVDAGCGPANIAVITPDNAQVFPTLSVY